METEKNSGNRIDSIDGLRGWSAVGVVVFHILLYERMSSMPFLVHSFDDFARHFVMNSAQFMILLFVLSGFVLSLPYLKNERSMNSLNDYRTFVVRRAKRLLPLYFCGFIFIASFVPHDLSPRAVIVTLAQLSTLTFHFFHPFSAFPFNPALWSLEMMWWCSLLIPLLLLISRRYGMTSMLCGLVCFSATARGILTLDISREYLAMHNIITKIDTFAIGIYIAHLYVHRKWNAPPWILIGVGVLVLHGGLVLLTLAQGEVISVRSSIISHFLVPSGWGMITLGCLRSKSKFVDVIVRNRFIVYIGLACFSVYVWHTPIIIAIKPHLNIYRFIESIILLTAVSTLSYTYIERSKR